MKLAKVMMFELLKEKRCESRNCELLWKMLNYFVFTGNLILLNCFYVYICL